MSQRSQAVHALLSAHLADAGSSFSAGSFGALAEFHRRADEPARRARGRPLTMLTPRGAIALEADAGLAPVAYETLGKGARWQHGVVFCLAEKEARGARRRVLTEVGPDARALRPADRTHRLFDLGLGLRNADFCVRTSEPALIACLRAHTGKPLLEPGNQAMSALLESSPPRVVLGSAARVEVYQPIAVERTPEGPHTHLLPRLMATGRTHAAGVPVPAGMRPAFWLHPAHPLFDALGRPNAFCRGRFEAFQTLLTQWGPEAYVAEKMRVRKAVLDGVPPQHFAAPTSRTGRTALRVTLRQLCHTGVDQTLLTAWTQAFERR